VANQWPPYSGPHVTFKGNWSQLSIPDFPGVLIQQTDLQLIKAVHEHWYNCFVWANVTASSSLSIDAYYTLPGVVAGSRIDVKFRLSPNPTDYNQADIDIYLLDPTGFTVASSSASGSVEDIVGYTALMSGNYRIGVDYWGVDYDGYYIWWNADPTAPLYFDLWASASLITHYVSTGLASSADTHDLGLNAAVDLKLKALTGTSLDLSTLLETMILNVSVTNFFPPTVTVLSPNGGEVYQRTSPITITWTASDPNVDLPPHDETLGFSVEVSNNSGVTWKTIVFGTTLTHATWVPSSAFYGLPAGTQFRVRVTVTDGRYTASDISDHDFTVQQPSTAPAPPWELYTVIIVAVVVVIILLATCLLKRRQAPAK